MTNHSRAFAKTLSETNQFVFSCPVFNVNTKIAACFELREQVWRGNKLEVRKGCQVCMRTDKCPINHILKDMMRSSDIDPYHSDVMKVGKLQERHLAHIERITVPERTIEAAIERGELGQTEVKLIRQANENAKITAGKKIRNASEIDLVLDDVPTYGRRKKQDDAPAEVALDATIVAATTGDMSSALNEAMKGSAQ